MASALAHSVRSDFFFKDPYDVCLRVVLTIGANDTLDSIVVDSVECINYSTA